MGVDLSERINLGSYSRKDVDTDWCHEKARKNLDGAHKCSREVTRNIGDVEIFSHPAINSWERLGEGA